MNSIEQLLQVKPDTLALREGKKVMHLTRVNMEIEFNIHGLDNETAARLEEDAIAIITTNKTGESPNFKTQLYPSNRAKVIAGCEELSRDKRFRDHFGTSTPELLIDKIMSKEEVQVLADAIDELTDYKPVTVEELKDEIKNS